MKKMKFPIITFAGKIVTGFTGVLLLSSCANVPCDAQQEQSTFTKARCLGAYERRTEELQLELDDATRLNTKLQAALDALEQEKVDVHGELTKGQAEYSSLNRAMQALLSDAKKQTANNAAMQAKIQSIENDLQHVNRSSANTSVIKKQQELNSLKNKLLDLEAAISG